MGSRLGGIFGSPGETIGMYAGGALPLLFCLWLGASVWRDSRDRRARARRDLADDAVQVIEVEDAPVLELHPIGDDHPAVCFDLGEGQLLLLKGQWLRDPATYGLREDPSEGDEGDGFLNNLPEPCSFPRSKFTVTRAPESGRVLRLEVGGDYVPPEGPVDALPMGVELGESLLFPGEITEVADALRRVGSERRKS
jgi:hypothetical protein